MSEKKKHYLEKAIEKLNQTGGLKPGKVTHVAVMHDNWCKLLKGKGECNCNPDIQQMPDKES